MDLHTRCPSTDRHPPVPHALHSALPYNTVADIHPSFNPFATQPTHRYPAFLTMCHMLACSLMSYGLAASRYVQMQPIKSRAQFYKITMLALIFCFTVVLGNVSLRFLPVSFTQAIGATTPAFTAAIALVFLSQHETTQVYLTLVPVVAGIIIASHAEPLFHLFGFTAAVGATATRAAKSVLQVCTCFLHLCTRGVVLISMPFEEGGYHLSSGRGLVVSV